MLSKKTLDILKKKWHPETLKRWVWAQEQELQRNKNVKRRTKKGN